MRKSLLVALFASACIADSRAQNDGASEFDARPRVIAMTDIGNEPDDAQSMIRFLLYSSDYEVESILATTSRHLTDEIQLEKIRERVDAYGQVYQNLRTHNAAFPEPELLKQRIGTCQPAYGMAAVGETWDSEGSRRIIKAVDSDDPRALWITAWGGANCLAQALWRVSRDRTPEQVDAFVRKIRVYAISDQDDSGPWLRKAYPNLFYIVSPSNPGRIPYSTATWQGISGEHFWVGNPDSHMMACIIKQRFFNMSCGNPQGGPDYEIVDHAWLAEHIRIGPMGEMYPRKWYIMEGDSPSFMNLIDNGLQADRSPAWGGWGGRYAHYTPSGEPRAIWSNSNDRVVGRDGVEVISNQATVWRWRSAYQHDFAARIAWTLAPKYDAANHPPVIAINGDETQRPIFIDAVAGESIAVSTSGSSDPDDNSIAMRYWQYLEAGTSVSTVQFEQPSDSGLQMRVPSNAARGTMHIIAEGTDNGTPAITRYRRIVLTIE